MVKFFQSREFKKVMLFLGIGSFFLTGFAVFKPGPFLKFGYFGVFLFNVVGSGTLLVPILAQHMNVFFLALATALGMAVNDTVSWLVGKSGDVILPRGKKVEKIEGTLHKYGPVGLFFWSLIPFPYDLIGLIAGYLEFPYIRFFIPTFLGKFVRFILLGTGTLAVIKLF